MVQRSRPNVSVIIPAFNAESVVTRALASLQAQSVPDWEALVIDDASRDNTSQVVGTLARQDHRIRLMRFNVNQGPGAARNRGIELSKGEWIALLDADDAYLPNRLEKLLDLARREKLLVVSDRPLVCDSQNLQPLSKQDGLLQIKEWSLQGFLSSSRPWLSPVHNNTLFKPLSKRSFLRKWSLSYNENLHAGEDTLFYLNMLAHRPKALILADRLYKYSVPMGRDQWTSGSLSRRPAPTREAPIVGYLLELTKTFPFSEKEVRALEDFCRDCAAYHNFEILKYDIQNSRLRSIVADLFMYPQNLVFLARAVMWRLSAKLGPAT